MEWLSDPQAWAALATLTALEIVLGIDNIIFISILVGRLPAHQREKARILGLALAMLTRLALLLSGTSEVQESLEGATETRKHQAVATFGGVLVQIAVIDIVFSLDSVITAIGLAQQISVMAIAIVISVLVMMFAARAISDFVDTHPTIKMLALSFLILVGTALIAEGLDFHVPRRYLYFSLAFSVAVEMLNLRMRRRAAPVKLHKPVTRER